MNTKTFLTIAALAAAVALPLAASAQPAVSLDAAARRAVATNPEVQAAWYEYQAAENVRRRARGGYLPRLDLGAVYGRERQEIDSSNTELDFDHRGVSLTLTQMLWDGLFTRSEVRSADHARRSRYFEVRAAAETAALEALRAYQDVQRYRELVSLARQNYDSHRQVYDQIAERVHAGVSRSVDLEQITGRLALAESNLVTEKSNLHDVSARYERVVGEPPAEVLEPAPAYDDKLVAGMEAALDLAFRANPAVNAHAQSIRANRYSVSSARSAYQPRLDIRLRTEHGEDINRIAGESEDHIAELVLSYNLINGGSDRARVREALDRTDVARYLRDKTCREVRQTVRIAVNDTERLAEQLRYLDTHRLTMQKTSEAFRNQFNIGQRTLLDLLDTENEAFEAQRAYVNADYDRSIAVGRALAGTGQLLVAMALSREDLARAQKRLGADLGADSDSRCPGLPQSGELVAIGDTDGDGVKDDVDLCPGTPPGTEVDEFGCEKKQAIVLNGVRFAYASSVLLPESREVLNMAAKTLAANPQIQVEIAGHTDSVGSAAYNEGLSQARAAAVVAYLVRQGVAPEQLFARGYGESMPVADNESEEGRAENRRVEFRVHNAE